jgi:hypothetical protein
MTVESVPASLNASYFQHFSYMLKLFFFLKRQTANFRVNNDDS